MIRAATPADRAALGAMLDRAFAKEADADRFLNQYPHLFTDEAIGQHLLTVENGAILGCVGCYRFAVNLHGAPLRAAGVGQVGTAPEARGRGLMTTLLAAALEAPDVDMFWLYGDRQRYGRVGFAPGGQVFEGLTWDRYAPPPGPGPEIRALDLASDDALIATALAARPFALVQAADERQTMLAGKRACGWTDGNALILLDPSARTVWAAHGSVDAIMRLIGHQVAMHHARDPKDSGVTMLADPDDLPALAAVRALAAGVTTRPTCMLRVGRLRPLLAAWAAAHPPPHDARLRPCVLDGGAAGCVRIACAAGRWLIDDASGPGDLPLTGAELAELVFGLVPVATWALPDDSVVRYLLPLHFAIPPCYAL